MGRLANVETDVFSVFDSAEWKAEQIKTIPVNFSGAPGGEYVRVKLLTGRHSSMTFAKGVLMVDIFTPAGEGSRRATTIADKLDRHLLGKTFGSTQFQDSSFEMMHTDKDNPTLFRSLYSIPFLYFGVV